MTPLRTAGVAALLAMIGVVACGVLAAVIMWEIVG